MKNEAPSRKARRTLDDRSYNYATTIYDSNSTVVYSNTYLLLAILGVFISFCLRLYTYVRQYSVTKLQRLNHLYLKLNKIIDTQYS